jgi:GTP-binding protein
MKIISTDFIISAVRQSQYPEDVLPEFLVVGRSNVGKSSFINAIINRKNFARTSSRPGKTQTLNFFLINKDFYLVDVPGYGYAAVNKKQQLKFGKMIEKYLENRENLKEVFMLIDFRHKPTQEDLLMYNFLKYHNLKVVVIATKVDKVPVTHRIKHEKQIHSTLDLVHGDSLLLFSSLTKDGKKEVHDVIEKYLDFIDE